MYTNAYEYLLWYYKHSMPPTCYGHSCGHPQEGALKGIHYKIFFKPMHTRKLLSFEIYSLKYKI